MATALRVRSWIARPGRAWAVLCVVVYVVLVISGITNSSLSLLDDPVDGAQGLLAGTPRPIRSDEWIKATPQLIGQLATGDGAFMPTLATPVEPGGTSAAGPISALLSLEYLPAELLARWSLPIGVAATWWLPALIFAVSLPALLRRFGVSPALGAWAVVLIAFSPANAWWSWIPVGIAAYASLASWAAVAGTSALTQSGPRRWLRTGLAITLSGVALAKLAVSYFPWVVVLGIPILTMTMAWIIWRRPNWRQGLAVVGTSAVLGVLLTLGYAAENRTFFEALAGTVYPAARQVTGAFVGLPLLLGAPQLWFIQRPSAAISSSNASEISSSYTVLILVAAVCLFAFLLAPAFSPGAPRLRLPRHSLALGIPITAFLAWCSVSFPARASALPLLSLTPPGRVAQVIGIPITILAVLAMAGLRRTPHLEDASRSLAVPAGIGAFALLAPSASALATTYVPGLPLLSIWAVSAAWALGVALLFAFPSRVWSLAPLGLLAILTTLFVNPAQQGVADLRSSDAADALALLETGLAEGERVATSDPYANAILMANGTPLLNGYQGAPNSASWAILDPDGRFEDVWNRGASIVQFEWLGAGTPLEIVTPQADLVVIRADPCDPRLTEMDLGGVVASADLGTRTCLTPLGPVSMAGQPHWLYERIT